MNPFESFFLHYGSQPIPPHLQNLLSITKKRDLKKLVQTIEVSKVDLVTLTHTCLKIGYHHFIEYGDWIPLHLKSTQEEKAALQRACVGRLEGKAPKYSGKIANIFEERRYRVGHLFVGNQRWHLLFFELHDMKDDQNHWVAGSHIHFTNDLCSPLGIDEVSAKFTALDFEIGERMHIKWAHQSQQPTPIPPS